MLMQKAFKIKRISINSVKKELLTAETTFIKF